MEQVDEISLLREALKDREERIMVLEKAIAYAELQLAALSTRDEDLMKEGVL